MEEFKKLVKKSKLTKEEINEFIIKRKNMDPKQDHSSALRTMTNQIRRDLLKFIQCEIKTFEDIKKNFDFDDNQLSFHLSMLKQTLFVIDSEEGWKLTPRGIGFLENTQLSD